MTLRRTTYGDLDAYSLSGPQATITAVPSSGARIVSLISTASGREWLWSDPRRWSRPPSPDGPFVDAAISGWDECFPTIAACVYPAAPTSELRGRSLPDHGELWSRSWTVVVADDTTLALRFDSGTLPYVFERAATFSASGALRLEYRLESVADEALNCFWSAHPLFAAVPGMRAHLPPSLEMTKEFGFGGRIGHDGPDGSYGRFSSHHWPHVVGADGARRDLSLVALEDPPVTDKVVVRGLSAGWAELCEPVTGEAVRVEFPKDLVPYVGVCTNFGAWPFEDHPGKWIAIEPTTGGTDRLDIAVQRGEAVQLPPRGIVNWTVEVSFHRCRAAACRHSEDL